MKRSFLLAVAMLGIAFVTGQTFKMNLKESVDRIQGQINVTKHKPAHWDMLGPIIEEALDCLANLDIGLPLFKVEEPKWMSPTMVSLVESITYGSLARDLRQMNWPKEDNGAGINDALEDFKKYVNTTDYANIHKHVFTNAEFLDLLRFLYNAGYDDIYTSLNDFYSEIRKDLPIPNGPDWEPTMQLTAKSNVAKAPRTSGNRLPVIKFQQPSAEDSCGINDLLALVEKFNATNIHEIIKVFLYLLQEILGNVAMHVFLLKLGEPHKGQLFKSTFELPEMKNGGIRHVKGIVLEENGIKQLNAILKQVTGLDLANDQLFDYVINLIMYIVWNYDFPQN